MDRGVDMGYGLEFEELRGTWGGRDASCMLGFSAALVDIEKPSWLVRHDSLHGDHEGVATDSFICNQSIACPRVVSTIPRMGSTIPFELRYP